ncbi:MAG: hypothetical protein AB7E36_12500 [Salinivirgaceae bacterium]
MMRYLLTFILALTGLIGSSQVFNTSQTLKEGTFSFGIEPLLIASGNSDFMLFGHAGYGLVQGVDLGLKVGVFGGSTYVGADVEFAFIKNFSISAGAHATGIFGLDATLIGSFPLASNVTFYGGLDADLNFGKDLTLPLWIPLGLEVHLNKNMAFLFEALPGITQSAPHLIGGGVMVYF